MSIFNDKVLKSVAEAAAKVMQQEELKGNQHKIDANKNGKIDAHDFKLLRAGKKPEMKKEEVEQIDEISADLAGKYLTAPQGKGANKYKTGEGTSRYPNADTMIKHGKSLKRALQRADTSSLNKKPSYYKEEEQLDEAFPTVADAKKRMDAGKTATGTVTKTKTGLVHKRDYKDDESEDMQKKKAYGARQKRSYSTKVYKESFLDMIENLQENGIKSLNGMFDAVELNEEPDNEQFTKELKDQEASMMGKKKQPEVAKPSVQAVKMEDVEVIDANEVNGVTIDTIELDERELSAGETAKKEKYVKSMKKGLAGFKERYGDRAKSVMYATATKMAKKD